ncbi:MAG TPA: siderophore-interacting protein [Rhodanobacter sp.]
MNLTRTPAMSRSATLGRTVKRLFMTGARVLDCEPVAEKFRLVTLESPQFRSVRWIAGQKIQIGLGSGFVTRTYTPIEWDAAVGQTRILGYLHGPGPGSAWLRHLKKGDECDVVGPRISLDLEVTSGPPVVFGDETSIGIVWALAQRLSGPMVQGLLEVDSLPLVLRVLESLNLSTVELFQRASCDAHLSEIECRLNQMPEEAKFILTGKASSIQRMSRTLKELGVPRARLATKAYWALGKAGLD